MAPKKRVHELAKELGMTNKETLDLCESLGIGVKTHSSSIEDAQADRVRRKAEREGLIRDVQPEEPAKPAKAAKKTTKKAAAPAEAPPAPVVEAPAGPGSHPRSRGGGAGAGPRRPTGTGGREAGRARRAEAACPPGHLEWQRATGPATPRRGGARPSGVPRRTACRRRRPPPRPLSHRLNAPARSPARRHTRRVGSAGAR